MINDPVLNNTAFLTNSHREIVGERSALQVFTTFHTEHWPEDKVSPVCTPLPLPDELAPGAYDL